MIIDTSGTITTGGKINYLRTLLNGEALHEFKTLCANIGHTTSAHLEQILLLLGTHLFTINAFSKQKRAMRHRTRKTCELKARRYAENMAKLNEYLSIFPYLNLNKKLDKHK